MTNKGLEKMVLEFGAQMTGLEAAVEDLKTPSIDDTEKKDDPKIVALESAIKGLRTDMGRLSDIYEAQIVSLKELVSQVDTKSHPDLVKKMDRMWLHLGLPLEEHQFRPITYTDNMVIGPVQKTRQEVELSNNQ